MPDPAESLLFVVRDKSGTPASEIPLKFTGDATSGIRGGTRATWGDTAGMVSLEIITRPDPLSIEMHVTTQWDIAGRHPDDILASLETIAALRPGATAGISPSFGPRRYSYSQPLAHAPANPKLTAALRLVKALSVVQQHYTQRLVVPAATTSDELRDLVDAAQLLQGQAINGTWANLTFTANADADPDLITVGARIQAAIVGALVVTLDNTEHFLGQSQTFFADATITSANNNTITAEPTPGGSNKFTRVLVRDRSTLPATTTTPFP